MSDEEFFKATGRHFDKVVIDKPANESGIIKTTKDETAGGNVRFIGSIDKDLYKCVADNITTDEVIITEERIAHIEERHPGHFEIIEPFLKLAVEKPDYILEDKKNSALILKSIKAENLTFQVILRLHTTSDVEGYKNSIISAWKISERRWKNYINNKKILYKNK